MSQATIVTGATGFLGSHLVAGILDGDADVTVICLARPNADRTAQERVLHAVGRAYRDRNEHDGPIRWVERVVVIEHDLGEDELRPLGVADVAGRVFQIDEFWHCAAAVEFTGERGGRVWRANVDGLRNALTIANLFGVRVFNHISTAYVAGTLTGRIADAVEPSPRAYYNLDAESKHLGEDIVVHHCRISNMNYRIFRRSIMIPVDIAVAEMLELATLGVRTFGQVFHFTGESPVSTDDAVRPILETVGVDRVEVVGPDTDLNGVFESGLGASNALMSEKMIS
jgi:nucleoside-diphosphate-sugar epimerase